MCNIFDLSELFVCLGGLVKVFSVWGTEKIVGLWYTRGRSVSRLTLWAWKNGVKHIHGRDLGYRYHTFPNVGLLLFHEMPNLCYSTSYKMHGFSHQFLIACENAVKTIHRYPCIFQSTAISIPSSSHSLLFYITWEMHGFPQEFLIAWENDIQIPILVVSIWCVPLHEHMPKRVKNSMHHFCLWHLSGTLEWGKWKNKSIKLNSWSFFFYLC